MFAYVQNNPVNRIDPTGHGAIAVGACVVLTIGDAAYTGYSLNKLQKEIEKLREEKQKLSKACESKNLSVKELEKLLDQINEIDKQILKKLSEETKTEIVGIYIGGPALVIFCAAAPYLPF